MKQAIFIFGFLIIAGFAYSAPNVAPPTSEQLTLLISADPAADTIAIKIGYDVTALKCVRCHKFKDPAKFTLEEWNKILPKMAKKAKLTEEQTAQVRSYVTAFCEK